MSHVLSTSCPLDCPDACSLAVTVDAGHIVKIDADSGPDSNPFTQGFICHKVKHQARRVYAPERVLVPLIRDGPKGSGAFREASWDEAIRLVAVSLTAAIAQHGASSVVPYLYSSSAGVIESSGLTQVLFARLGCPEVEHTICASTVDAAWKQMYGEMLSADPFDLACADLVVIWGANPTASNTHLLPLITAASKRGAQVVVIDPRATGIAKRADLHLPILPGTDVVLALAVVRWLVENGHHDSEFLAAHTAGADQFIAAASEWTLARAACECGLDESQIEQLARLIAEAPRAMLRLGLGLERNRNGGSSCLAIQGLWLVAGHFGQLGSGVIGSTSATAPIDRSALWPSTIARPDQAKLSMNDVGLVLNGEFEGWPQTRLLFVQGANPVATAMDQQAWITGLERDDLFTVVHEQVMTDTAALADVVLPATTHFEISDLAAAYGTFTMQQIRPVIGKVGESRSNNEVAGALASALGFAASEFNPDHEELLATVRTDGKTGSVAQLRASGGTVQFVDTFPFAGNGERARMVDPASARPLPEYIAAVDDRLIMLSPATNRTINSMFAEFDPPEIAITIHPADAAKYYVSHGDTVRVSNELGEVVLLAYIDSSVRPGVASVPKGLWRRHFGGHRTINALIPRGINDLGRGACFNDARIAIQRISR